MSKVVCKERLSRVACLTFICISGLFFTPSFTFLNDTANSRELDDDEEDQCLYEFSKELYVVVLKNSSEQFCCLDLTSNRECSAYHHLPSTLRDFNFEKITCIMDMKYNLSCFWSVTNLPKDAVYSADVSYVESQQNLNCFHIMEKEVVECHSNVTEESEFILKVNISLPTLLYRIGKMFKTDDIVKPSPPDNIRISNHQTKLEINWTLSEKDRNFFENSICYTCELKINDEVLRLPVGQLSYIKQDVDVTRKYAIQVRVKLTSSCGNINNWSDWSSVHEVGPFENKYSVNLWVIAVIAFVLPMLLLAILLICKCQRLPKKLFPPIPSPSVNVKNLLEKENYFLDLSSRCVYHDVHTIEERNG